MVILLTSRLTGEILLTLAGDLCEDHFVLRSRMTFSNLDKN